MEYASLRRGLEILKLVQDLGRGSAAEISAHLGVPRSTVYRYLTMIKESGFAVEVDGGLVPSERLAEGWSDSSNLVRVAAPVLRQLREDLAMTAVLAVRVHTAALSLDVCYAHAQHRISFRRGQMRGLHAGASALALLAYAPDQIVRSVLERGYRGYTAATLSPAQLAHELEQIRTRQFATSRGQTTPGMMAAAVPIMMSGLCVASLSLVDEMSRRPAGDELAQPLHAAAAELAAAIEQDEASVDASAS
jgi:DNA-binding IclR family transcriptional regulator